MSMYSAPEKSPYVRGQFPYMTCLRGLCDRIVPRRVLSAILDGTWTSETAARLLKRISKPTNHGGLPYWTVHMAMKYAHGTQSEKWGARSR